MTLRQLRDRLNTVFAENERIATLGWDGDSNRNDLPLAIRLESRPVKADGKYGYKSRFVAVDRLEASRTGLDGHGYVCFTADEIEGHLWPPAKSRKATQEVK